MISLLMRRGRSAGLLLLLGMAACTALLNTKADQCGSDADCTKFSATAVCQVGVCVDLTATDGAALDGQVKSDGGNLPDGNSGLPDGCVPKVPVSQGDFLNEKCTNASCIPFDNCARLGVCDGSLPPLVIPDGGF